MLFSSESAGGIDSRMATASWVGLSVSPAVSIPSIVGCHTDTIRENRRSVDNPKASEHPVENYAKIIGLGTRKLCGTRRLVVSSTYLRFTCIFTTGFWQLFVRL